VPDKSGEVVSNSTDLSASASHVQAAGSNALGFALRRVRVERQSQKPVNRGFDNRL
jgi:hypothetical protein